MKLPALRRIISPKGPGIGPIPVGEREVFYPREPMQRRLTHDVKEGAAKRRYCLLGVLMGCNKNQQTGIRASLHARPLGRGYSKILQILVRRLQVRVNASNSVFITCFC